MLSPLSRSAAVRLAGGLFVLSLVVPAQAYAYIDPISGSIILQVVAAGALATAYTLKRFWQRILSFVRNVWARGTP